VEPALLESETATVEVASDMTANGPRLRVCDTAAGLAVYLDPLELEGLTKVGEVGFAALLDGGEATVSQPTGEPRRPEVLQNEFAMVEVGATDGARGACLFVRDLASRTEVLLDPETLRRLTALSHGDLAPLLDPSHAVQAAEPDPDQV
jgi:hypothetical protein